MAGDGGSLDGGGGRRWSWGESQEEGENRAKFVEKGAEIPDGRSRTDDTKMDGIR